MNKIINIVFPKTIDNNLHGYKIVKYIFMILAAISFIRSCIHLFSPDGGAGSIASLDLSTGAQNIIFSFALWGGSQLIYAVIQLLVASRYGKLIPFMYIMIIFETIIRMYIGFTKPPIVAHVPLGGIANYVLLPLGIIMFVLCIITPKKENVS